MNTQNVTRTQRWAASFHQRRRFFAAKPKAILAWAMVALLFLAVTASAPAQSAIRFQFAQVRVTVPVNSGNSTLVTGITPTNNTVVLVSGCTNANFTIAGLPTGATAVLTDTNGVPLTSISNNNTPVWMMVNTTNVAEGVYNFTLTANGLDTNGLPVANAMPFVLQVAHIWFGRGLGNASFGLSNNWSQAASWLGGVPGPADDVVFGDYGAQTNATSASGIATTNIGVDTSMTVASIRFAQDTFSNTNGTGSTNSLYHTLRIAPGAVLTVTGTNGFSLLRDYVTDLGISPDNTMAVNILGTNAAMVVSNANANFSIELGNQEQPTLNFSNLGTLGVYVSRAGFADYQLYPNYTALNTAFNGGRNTNTYSGLPRRFIANIYLARTNYFTALYKDANNYTNEFTRSYAISLQNNEQSGNGSSVNTFFYLGLTNQFFADSICFIGAAAASGNTGGAKFNFFAKVQTNGVVFRNSDGVSRMSMFAVGDDGGPNQADSNVKATVDFSGGNNYVDLLADRFYVARDRTLIASNQTPNVQGTVTFGNCKVNVNSLILGFQEHSNKIDWTTLDGAQPYLNYCQGKLILTNSGFIPSVFTVNGNLNLGYTADRNPVGSAEQYFTYGQITLYSNVTLIASNIVVDGGLNYLDGNGRQNTITINQGANLVVSNTAGFPIEGANDFSAADPRGMKLDALTISGGTLTVALNPAISSVTTRSLTTPGIIPGTIRVSSLVGVTSFPVQIPVISYEGNAAPFLNADVSALGPIYHGYVLNNPANNSVDVYITTNSPNNLVWTGNVNNNWDTSTLNWKTSGGLTTNFNLGDIVAFNDSTTVTNVFISGVVVPGQTGVGVSISNAVNQYVFTGGTIAGTALVSKQGTNAVEFDASEQGPMTITAGSVTGINSGGQIGAATVYGAVTLKYAGAINGGLTSTGAVTLTGSLLGPVSIQGGSLDNFGIANVTPNSAGGFVLMANASTVTNEPGATMNIGTGVGNSSAWDVPFGSTLANFGQINLYQPRINIEGLLYGTGTINDPNGGGHESIANGNAPLVRINALGVLSPGLTPINSLANMNLYCRFDYENDPKTAPGGVGTVRVEFDFSNPQVHDTLNIDRWNNDTGYLLLTNINPSAGSFIGGQIFQIFQNSSGDPSDQIDTLGFCPTIIPYVPGPGLQWGVGNFNLFGVVTVTNSPMVWDGLASANWSTNPPDTSWKVGQSFVEDQGAVFNDSASGSTTVNLTTTLAPAGYVTYTYSNIVAGVSTNVIVVTNQPNFYPGIVVSNALKNYVIAGTGKITGITGLYKTGPGTLTLMTSNDFIGNVIVDNGTLAVTNYGALVNIPSLGVVGAGQMENDLILDGGTLSFVGLTNCSLNNYPVLNPNGGTFNVASATNILTLVKAAVGSGSLTKTGPGELIMTVASDNYSGGTFINAGTVSLTSASVGSGALTLNNTATLILTNNLTLTNTITIAGPATTIQTISTVPGTNIFTGPWTGGGTATFNVTNMYVFTGDLSGLSGTLEFGASTGGIQFNNATNKNFCTGSSAATFDLGTGTEQLNNLNGGGLTYNLGALSGGPNTVVSGRITNSAAIPGTTYSIGGNGNNTTFSGIITNGLDTVNVIKVGIGSLWLNGNSTYSGFTTVSNGFLGGTGSLASPLTVVPGGTLAPGAPFGTFTVNNNVTLGGGTVVQLSGTTNGELAVTGTLTVGGTLVVTNIGADIVNGTTFKLFNQAVSGFTSATLPAQDPTHTKTYTWNNNLAANGTIQLASGGSTGVNSNPTNIVTSVSGGTLSLSWPADHIGWTLQVQTNSLNTGLGTNWITVPGSTTVDNVAIPLDSKNGAVFYRLTLQ